jgi:hypothetical protein
MKKCTICKLYKDLSFFHRDSSRKDGIGYKCKSCIREYVENKTDHLKMYRDSRKEKSAEYLKEYRKKNRLALNKKSAEYEKRKKQEDTEFKLRRLLRDRLRKALKNSYKGGSAVSDLGCNISFLKTYLESKFVEGMEWSNHGKWHIDHIVPLSSFDLTQKEQILVACHYTNLQPLWAVDNIKKSNR